MTTYAEFNRISEKMYLSDLISTLSNLVTKYRFEIYSQYLIKEFPNYLAVYDEHYGIAYCKAHKTNLKDYIINYKDCNGVMTKDKLKEFRLRKIISNARAVYKYYRNSS